MEDPISLPKWVVRPTGQREPFDGDRISRALFAATRQVGQPDPFLARELTDGVLHFLAADGAADSIPLDEVIDATVKVVRELGHPLLARAFAEMRAQNEPRPGPTDDWPPDLRAAEQDGLLRFFDASAPSKIAGMLLPPTADGWIDSIRAARDWVDQFVAIDGPEFLLPTPAAATDWVRAFQVAVNASGLRAVVNLNSSEPPDWAVAESGPLFGPPNAHDADLRRQIADKIADGLLAAPASNISVEWHLVAADFELASRERLMRLSWHVAQSAPIVFAPDRPRRTVTLGDGLDRDNIGVLAVIGIGLPRLMEIVREGAEPQAETVLAKMGSLARLALSAGRFRRGVIRRREPAAGAGGFLADRARLVVMPLGIDEVVHQITGQSWTAGQGLKFVRDILLTLNASLLRDAGRLRAVIGTPSWLEDPGRSAANSVAPRQQLRAAAVLHAAIGSGKAVVDLETGRGQPAEIIDLLEFAWRLPGLERFALIHPKRQLRQTRAGR